MNFVLVLYIYAGVLAKGDSVTVTTVSDFPNLAMCQSAGKESALLVESSSKNLRYVCLRKQ